MANDIILSLFVGGYLAIAAAAIANAYEFRFRRTK